MKVVAVDIAPAAASVVPRGLCMCARAGGTRGQAIAVGRGAQPESSGERTDDHDKRAGSRALRRPIEQTG